MTSSRPPGSAPASIDCETAVRRLWDHLDGRLPMRAREEVEAHLDACELCPRHFEFARAMRAALARAALPPVVDADDPLHQRVRAALDRLWASGELQCGHRTVLACPFPSPPDTPMQTLAILARLEARPGKEAEVETFLRSALPLAQAETGTVSWYALRLGPSTFGIFDTFGDQRGREAHLSGEIARALFARAEELLAEPPRVEMVDVLAAKSPGA